MPLPDFTADQRKRLTRIGVLPEQIERLRYALVEVKRALRPPPRRNDTKKVLDAVTKHADALAKLLENMWNQTDMAHTAAMIEVEQRYWEMRPDDIGPSSAHNVIPRLAALADAARDAAASIPPDQSRHRTGSAKPIRSIHDALLSGWLAAQKPREIRIIDNIEYEAGLPPYPDTFHPHESEVFLGIVAICYEAAGAPRDYEPLAAVRAYVRSKKLRPDEFLAGITGASSTARTDREVRASAKRDRRQ